MKIILLKDIKKQGKKNDVMTVKDGYGTFLINKGDAVLATDNSLNRLDREIKAKQEEEKNIVAESEKIKHKLEKTTLTFKVKTGDKDRVFGSISAKQIVEELKSKGFDIDKKQIKMNESLSSLGFHSISIELHKKVIANLKIELKK